MSQNTVQTAETMELASLVINVTEAANAGQIIPGIRNIDRDNRMFLVMALRDEGFEWTKIAVFLNIGRTTLYQDIDRYNKQAENFEYMESVFVAGDRINRRFDKLYAKAMRANNIEQARIIEEKRISILQSLGIIHKEADQIDITDGRTKEDVIEEIIAELVKDAGEAESSGLPALQR